MAQGRETVLRVRGLSYRARDLEVFVDVSFSLEAGQVAFLVGPNDECVRNSLRSRIVEGEAS